MNNHHLRNDAVYNVLSDLTPNPFPTREGEQELKPLSASGRGLERGFNNNLHIVASTFTDSPTFTQTSLTTDAVYNVLSNLTPNPFPTFAQRVGDREGEQELKPVSWQGGFNDNLHIVASTSTNTAQLIPSNSPAIENPSAWIREGNSPTEIILATAILSSLLMGGIAGVIVAMTGLVKTINSTTVNQTTRNKKYFRKGVN
jgi:hypothetical protein